MRHCQFGVELGPFLVKGVSVFFVLLYLVHLALGGVHLQSFVKGVRIDFLQNSLEGNQGLLKDLVPMVVSQVHDHGHQHREGFVLVSLENVEEVVILEEAHCAVSNLQVNSPNTLHNSLEQFRNKRLDFLDLAYLEHLLQLSKEKGFLDAVSERPVLEETFEQGDSKSSILGQEEHRASQQLLVELGAGLDLVKGDDDVFEEDNVLVSQRHSETRNNRGKNIEQFSSTVELVSFMDQGVEAFVDRFSDHLSAGHQLCVELVKNVLQVVTLNGLLRVEKFEELLDELWGNVDLELTNFN